MNILQNQTNSNKKNPCQDKTFHGFYLNGDEGS